MDKSLKIIELDEEKRPKYGYNPTKKNIEELENAGVLLNDTKIVADFDNDNIGEEKIMSYFEKKIRL